jgi:capsular polysaccharide biosynthesis protein/Mrp family chromosome partitioning ATPase
MNDSFDHPEADASALPAQPVPMHGVGRNSEHFREYGSPDLKRDDTRPSARFNIWWSLGGAVARRWYVLAVVALGLGGLGFISGYKYWHSTYTASVQLIRDDSPRTVELFGERQVAPQTYSSLLHAPELLQRVAKKANPPITPEALAGQVQVAPEYNSDIIFINATAKDPQEAIDLANLYADETVKFTRERQAAQAKEIVQAVTAQLVPMETEITNLNRMPRAMPQVSFGSHAIATPSSVVTGSPPNTALIEKIEEARVQLAEMLATMKDEHPDVIRQKAKLAALQNQLAKASAPVVTPAPILPATGSASASANNNTNTVAAASEPLTQKDDPDLVRSKLANLEATRLSLLSRKRTAEAFEKDPPGFCQLLAVATPDSVVKHGRKAKVICLAMLGGLVGIVACGSLLLLVEVMDNRIKTVADVERVTRLPVIATAGNLDRMSEGERKEWSFRAWTHLVGTLGAPPNGTLVCGVTSSGHREGRSTWVKMLAREACQCGFRVLTVASRPRDENNRDESVEVAVTTAAGVKTNGNGKGNGNGNGHETGHAIATRASVLAPAGVTQKLNGLQPHSMMHMLLPGSSWNLERRQQWQAAIHHWSKLENVAIFVELPPASEPEAVLLAEDLPNLVWLTEGGHASAAKTREQLETLRRARCNVVGAVLNRAHTSRLRNRLARWIGD